ncbi:MAG: hypothetical protein ABIP42_14190 [Planctomycetota bacterium]
MKTSLVRAGRALCLASMALGIEACGSRDDTARVGGSSFLAAPPEGSAILCGTVFDLASGVAAGGLEVSFEGGGKARTDGDGRFQIGGLALGAKGLVRVRSDDGRECTQAVLPLAHERREIVLNLPAR